MSPDEYLFEQLDTEPYYEAEEYFFEPFWQFMYRFQSLQRHWELSKGIIGQHVRLLSEFQGDGSAEVADLYWEVAAVDIEFFPEYLRLSTISFALSLVENLLGSVSEEVAKDLNVEIELDTRPLPHINKYLLWLTRGCDLNIELDKDVWKSLDAIRELRNRFMHKIDRDIPEQIRETMSEMVATAIDNSQPVNDEFVDSCLWRLARLVKVIELAYIEFYRQRVEVKE